jgi:hypothetical protein
MLSSTKLIWTSPGSFPDPESDFYRYFYPDLRGLEKVNGEIALVMTVYNFRPVINILGQDKLPEKIKT